MTVVRVAAIITAGGRGARLGGDVPKQLRRLGGRTILEHSLAPFEASARVHELIVTLPSDLYANPPAWLTRLRTPLRLVVGGERRQDSVAAAFDVVSPETDIVVVHDAARPFCTSSLIELTIDAAVESGAAIAALAAQDTIKEAMAGDGPAIVRATLPRERIFLAQTPQAFRLPVLRDAVALGRRGVGGTDEAALAERAGHTVRLVDGDARNMKITTEVDLVMARSLVDDSMPAGLRVGLGSDLHRLEEGRRLVLGGVEIDGSRGLLGHSDADAVCHAVIDAILGAAAAGDIGRHFPDDDPRWKDASSLDLLATAATIVRGRGFAVVNVDIVVMAEWPKIRDHADAMRARLSEMLGVDVSRVSVKGKTGEGVDAVGRGEAIGVEAVALLRAVIPPGATGA